MLYIQESDTNTDKNDNLLIDESDIATANPDLTEIKSKIEESIEKDDKSNGLGRYKASMFNNTKKSSKELSNPSTDIAPKGERPSSFALSRDITFPASIDQPVHSREFAGNKYDRIPSKLPQVMSTYGSPSNFREHSDHGVFDMARRNPYDISDYRVHYGEPQRKVYSPHHQKYATDYKRPSYYTDLETTSTWASQYQRGTQIDSDVIERKGRCSSSYESYTQYDKYKTMASMLSEPVNKAKDRKETTAKDEDPEKEEKVKPKEELKNSPIETDKPFEPPQLVRIVPSCEEKPIESLKDSPPALEKCVSSETPVDSPKDHVDMDEEICESPTETQENKVREDVEENEEQNISAKYL